MGFGIKTYLFYVLDEALGKHDWFGAGAGYHIWQGKRIRAMIEHYGVRFFEGKTLLELGAGYGDIGNVFSLLGAKVTCLEGRKSHVAEIKRRYTGVTAIQHNLNEPLPPSANKADFIIHFGLLYHLGDPEASLRNTCRACKFMALETECCDSDDPNFTRTVSEHAFWQDHAIDGKGSSPSPAFVERILTEEGMEFERVTDDRCNAEEHFYDWPLKNTGITKKGMRRFWFAKKKSVA
ncbi:MAG: methyltransferase FkbM family [Pedosphaera sp.]|jgi:SAM-dependent methyltransferase|nr:methyltransferase FkbM family [Pedosphaera sp.]